MVSTIYLRTLLEQTQTKQTDLAEEWSHIVGKTMYQTRVSNELKKEYTDSLSFLKAISNLTKMPLSDILMELYESKPLNAIVYTDVGGTNEMIPVSNNLRAAASSLLSAVNDPEIVEENDFISVPKNFIKPGGVKMLIRITGQSMVPSFMPDDYIACRLMDQFDWPNLRDDHVYLIIKKDNEALLKRVKNRIKEYGLLVCKSDNLDKKEFPDINVEVGEILQIWDVSFSLSWKFPNPHAGIENRFTDQENKIIDHESKIRALYEEMKKIKYEMVK